MKRIVLLTLSALFILLSAAGCTEPTVYNLSDVIPALIDPETQYPYVEKIIVTKLETGETVEFTEGTDHDRIRMQFEEIQCVRKKHERGNVGRTGYTVNFITTDGSTEVYIYNNTVSYQANAVCIGEYRYDCLASGVDQTFFENLFTEAE